MKILSLIPFILPALSLANEPIELPVENVFIPAHGYDDNDMIQVVVHGNLPNACYTLGETKVEQAANGGVFKVHQFAEKSTSRLCTEGHGGLPPHVMSLVPYTVEVSLGRQKAGEYKIQFWGEGTSGVRSREYVVEAAPTEQIDSLPYAAVSNAVVSDVVYEGQSVYLSFSGSYQNSCMMMDRISVKKEKDVYVVLPILKSKLRMYCSQVLVSFQYRVLLEKNAKRGQYLVHMRSRSGKALNEVFEVLPKP